MDTQSVIICENNQIEEPARKRFRSAFVSNELMLFASTSNTDVYDDDDNESVHSWQSYETAWVADSGDDWTLTEDDDHSSVTEYEIMEDDTVEESQDSESSSTCAEILDVRFPEGLLPTQAAESSSSLTDESGFDDCNGETTSNSFKSETSWKCLKCRAPTVAPRNFCFTCYQRRKSSRPPRPIRKLNKPADKKTPGHEPPSDISAAPASISNENLCTVCHIGIRDGAFVHRKTAHVACCYPCTRKIFKKRNATCPICRQSIQSTLKLFF